MMTDMSTSATADREAFDAKVRALEGLRVFNVDYWDVHNFSPEPAIWDWGDWHHAVMGLQLDTNSGPVTVTWTNTFYPYGVEVFHEPIEHQLVLGEFGPERVGPDGPSRWQPYLESPVRRATVWWDRLELGAARLVNSGVVVENPRSVDIPTALRLDFDAGPVWFAAAIPEVPQMKRVFIPGDEILIVFTRERMREMGFVDPIFAS